MGPLTSCDIQQDTTTQLLEPGETLGQDVGWGTPAVAHLSDDESGVQRALPSSQAEDPPEIDTPPHHKQSPLVAQAWPHCNVVSIHSCL